MRFIQTIMVTTSAAATSIRTPSKPSSLIAQRWSKMAAATLAAQASTDASPDVGAQRAPARAIQIHEDNADDEGGFDAFAQSD